MEGQAGAQGEDAADRSISALLLSLRKKGVRLWSDGGQLRYRAGSGALTQAEIAALRASKAELILLLEHPS
jgi:pyochelin synthetase